MEIDEGTSSYIHNTDQFPLLNAKREVELAKIILSYKTGKAREKALAELVNHNLKLVVKEAFRFSKTTRLEIKDFIGAGNVGLFIAATKFNPEKFKTKFSTYATYWIREAMQDFTYRNFASVNVPSHIANAVAKCKKLMEGETKLTDKQLRKILKVNENGLKKIKDAHIRSVSMQLPIGGDSDDSTLGDTMMDENAVDPSQNASENDQYGLLYEALDELDETSRNIVMAQFLEGDKAKLRVLGRRFSITGEKVRQIRQKALKILRKKIEIKRKHGNGNSMKKIGV